MARAKKDTNIDVIVDQPKYVRPGIVPFEAQLQNLRDRYLSMKDQHNNYKTMHQQHTQAVTNLQTKIKMLETDMQGLRHEIDKLVYERQEVER
jgi:chromosome segregation ATPase